MQLNRSSRKGTGEAILVLLALLANSGAIATAQTPVELTREQPLSASSVRDETEDEPPAFGATKLNVAAPPYPAAIWASLEEKHQECLAAGGTAFSLRNHIVLTTDLNGDGWPDYLVDWRAGRCADRLTLFNGTGGWDLEIYAGRSSGRIALLFTGRVRNYDVLGPPAAPRIKFYLHGSHCGRAGTDHCVKTRRIGQRAFAFPS